MKKWEVATLLTLAALPILFLMGVGSWWLWQQGWWFYAWFPLAGCLSAAYLLALWRSREARRLRSEHFQVPVHWTPRDREAWHLIEARVDGMKLLDPKRMVDLQFYVQTAEELALDMARFYHPNAQDPVGSLTLLEILSVIELAAHDLAEMTERLVPGGHLLTINDWRRAGQVTNWYQRASNAYWAVSAILSPINTAVRYAASKVGLSVPRQMLQQELLAWFYTAFLHRTGSYLILLNSGRLRVGAKRYRELLAQAGLPDSLSAPVPPVGEGVTISIIGKVKGGKSSLVNALLGEHRAATSVVPVTRNITRYQYQIPAPNCGVVLLDTIGYDHAGPDADQLESTRLAVQDSDAVLLVLHACDPARRADVELLRALDDYFRSRPNLKIPPVLGVLTHIDLLAPVMDWTPPYNWMKPERTKERSIQDALTAAREQLGARVIDIVPVCVAERKAYGVSEWLLPRIAEILEEARAVALLRCLAGEADTGQWRKMVGQVWRAGKHLARKAAERSRR